MTKADSGKSLAAILTDIKTSLHPNFEESEARFLAFLLLEHFAGISKTKALAFPETIVPNQQTENIQEAIDRLNQQEPIQYILGETEFYELTFGVSPAVLIPRPETEELVQLIIGECEQTNVSILDIGTGSGCIPISLTKNLPGSKATAFDVSAEALQVATKNGQNLQADVTFQQVDILDSNQWNTFPSFDIIVSNPPYVCDSEKKLMKANVLEFEPELALFVSDSDPLLFYRTITQFAQQHLNKGGKLYFEINEQFGKETAQLLIDAGFEKVEVIQDLFGKDRVVKGVLV